MVKKYTPEFKEKHNRFSKFFEGVRELLDERDQIRGLFKNKTRLTDFGKLFVKYAIDANIKRITISKYLDISEATISRYCNQQKDKIVEQEEINESHKESEEVDEVGIKLHSAMDAKVWAEEFSKTAIKLGYSSMDEEWLFGWFANAIMKGYDAGVVEGARRAQENIVYRILEDNPLASVPEFFDVKPIIAAIVNEQEKENQRITRILRGTPIKTSEGPVTNE